MIVYIKSEDLPSEYSSPFTAATAFAVVDGAVNLRLSNATLIGFKKPLYDVYGNEIPIGEIEIELAKGNESEWAAAGKILMGVET